LEFPQTKPPADNFHFVKPSINKAILSLQFHGIQFIQVLCHISAKYIELTSFVSVVITWVILTDFTQIFLMYQTVARNQIAA
jgi:hypothetical protein